MNTLPNISIVQAAILVAIHNSPKILVSPTEIRAAIPPLKDHTPVIGPALKRLSALRLISKHDPSSFKTTPEGQAAAFLILDFINNNSKHSNLDTSKR